MSDRGGFVLRDCRPEEAGAVVELWRLAGATPGSTDTTDDLRRAVDQSLAHILVAEVRGRVVGSVLGTFDGWQGNVYRRAVLPGPQQRRLARALVAEIEKRLTQQGARRVTAWVERDRPEAVRLWKAAGYARDQRLVHLVRPFEAQMPGAPDSRTEAVTFQLRINDCLVLTEF